MKTIKAEITHAGPRAVAVPIVGGSLTVWPQDKLTGVDILPVSKEREELYKSNGVTFVFGRAPSTRKAGGTSQPVNIAALEKALADAKAAYELAHQAASMDEATDADHQALQQAIDAVEDAEENLEQAKK
ncbi:hypothetical protein J2Z19_003254 [Ensifer adhaerens]|uniref:Uncharacterized protein n=1 Tax=Ensifer adhaerens TaxID=106592 RepID=A0ACC5SYR7_ENSAD|nr:hypothetical protein [Ensifer adhaerens]MBP1873539.1 hypothetical protein [Ensifer adhaerens]